MPNIVTTNFYIGEGDNIGTMPAAWEQNNNSMIMKALKASANISKGQLLKVSGDLTVAPATAITDTVIGVAFADYKSGDPVVVTTEGLVYLTANAAITAGAFVGPATNGSCTTVNVSNATEHHVGIALSNAAANGACIVKMSL